MNLETEVRPRAVIRVVALVVLLAAPLFVWGLADGEQRLPTRAESAAIGWRAPEEAGQHARDLFERANDERRARGAPPLQWHEGLAETARRWSVEMISTGVFEHSSAEYRAHPLFQSTAENILVGHRDTGEAHVAWMGSDAHRAAILDTDLDAVGIGVVCRNDGRMWATQVFGIGRERTRPRPPVDLAPDPVVRDEPGPSCPVAP